MGKQGSLHPQSEGLEEKPQEWDVTRLSDFKRKEVQESESSVRSSRVRRMHSVAMAVMVAGNSLLWSKQQETEMRQHRAFFQALSSTCAYAHHHATIMRPGIDSTPPHPVQYLTREIILFCKNNLVRYRPHDSPWSNSLFSIEAVSFGKDILRKSCSIFLCGLFTYC